MPPDGPPPEIAFVVPGPPKAWERAGYNGRATAAYGHKGHFYTPAPVAIESHAFSILARATLRGRPAYAGPILLGIRSVFAIPQSWPLWKREAARRGIIRPTGKPDFDNLYKLVSDALNKVVWLDDAQVVGTLPDTGKFYGNDARTEVRVAFLPHLNTEEQFRALTSPAPPNGVPVRGISLTKRA